MQMQLGEISCFDSCFLRRRQQFLNFNSQNALLKSVDSPNKINRLIKLNKLPNMLPTKTDSRRRLNATGATIGSYSKVGDERSEVDGFVNEQWVPPSSQGEFTPWKTIAIIMTLFIGGSICIGCATLEWLADVNQDRSDRVWALVVIGALTIIPGGYYFYMLSCIILRRNGYTMDDIRRLG